MLKELDDWDWAEVFGFCGEEGSANNRVLPQPCVGYNGKIKPVSRKDVKRIIAMEEGENNGETWVGVFKLKDGRYLFVEAGCDYTGWDCQAGGSSWIGSSLEQIINFGMTQDARDRLKIEEKIILALAGVEEHEKNK